ncbi:AUGMIN subunit 5 [Linum perenne]
MQSSSSSMAQPDAILEWLHKEMGYRPLGPYTASTNKSQLPSVDALRKICRGNMIPVWSFLITRVKSEKTVESIRKNITVHGVDDGDGHRRAERGSKDDGGRSKGGGRRKEKAAGGEVSSAVESRDSALQERELAAKEVERLRNIVGRQRKDLKARMLEVSREEAERKRMIDERSKNRFVCGQAYMKILQFDMLLHSLIIL